MVSLPSCRYIRGQIVPSIGRTCHEPVISPTDLASGLTAEAGCNCHDQGGLPIRAPSEISVSTATLPPQVRGPSTLAPWVQEHAVAIFPLPRKRGK